MTSINPKLPVQNPEFILKGLSLIPKKKISKQPNSVSAIIESLTSKFISQDLIPQNRKWIPLLATGLSGAGYLAYKYLGTEPNKYVSNDSLYSMGNTLKMIAFVGASSLGVYFAKTRTKPLSSVVNTEFLNSSSTTTNLKNQINSFTETTKNLNDIETHNHQISLLDSLKELLETDQLDITLLFSDLRDQKGAEFLENELIPLIFNQLISNYKSAKDRAPISKILDFFEELHTVNKKICKNIFESFYLIFFKMIESLLDKDENQPLIIRACDLVNTMILDELIIFLNNPELTSREFYHIINMITPYMYASKQLKFYENFINKYPEQAWKFAMLFLDKNMEYLSNRISFKHICHANEWPRTTLGNRIRSDAINCTFSNPKDGDAFNFVLNYILAKLDISKEYYLENIKSIRFVYKTFCAKSELISNINKLKTINNEIINEMIKLASNIHQITIPSEDSNPLAIKNLPDQNIISLENNNEETLQITNFS